MLRLIRTVFAFAGCIVCFSAALAGAEIDEKKDAKKYVEEALRYELRGEQVVRNILLREALAAAPDYPPANWHSGRMMHDGRWLTIADAQREMSTDERLAQYRELRSRASDDVNRQLQLARWCARVRLKDLAELHFAILLRNEAIDDETRAEAMSKLGLKNVAGALLTDENIRDREQTAKLIEKAMKSWRPKLEKWQEAFAEGSDRESEFAAKQMLELTDPYVIPVSETFLNTSSERFGKEIVSMLGRFPQHEATESLVRFAVNSSWPQVRQAANRQLKERPIHDFVPMLLVGLVAPIESQWQMTRDPAGSIRYVHSFYRAGVDQNVALTTENVVSPSADVEFRKTREPQNPLTSYSLDSLIQLPPGNESKWYAIAMLYQAYQRESQLAETNAQIAWNNSTGFAALETTTDIKLPQEPSQWWEWWQQYNEVYQPKPTQYLYRRSQSYYTQPYIAVVTPLSCFVRGTPVWTETGRVPIEQVQIGDRVLSQDPDTGELSFNLVINTTIRPPSELVRIGIDGVDILATKGHPMWITNKGWQMVKQIEPGDQLHGVSGGLVVEEVEKLNNKQEAHNLVVAGSATYFVGDVGVLVHDNTYRKPTRALVPGLPPD